MRIIRNLLRALREGSGPSLEETTVKPLNTLESLDACLSASKARPLFIFKHSTACPISAAAYREVTEYATGTGAEDPDVYLVKVIEDRPVSNKIAEVLGVAHKSPQVILVRDGQCAWTASHHGIRTERMREAVDAR
ncbi:MAG: bacillithiol system redox-active protein YtxJ [Candidatus Hydrogenedentes bacterium]|nr:bacillithiol system redox-active protein YtxJ [Candidatus Hydrogenedentota bacterium]